MGLSQFAFKLWEPHHPTETSGRRPVLLWARKAEGWGIQCLATHWEAFAWRLGPLSQPSVAGSSGHVGRSSESCWLIPFPPHLTLEQDLPPNQARPSAQWASRSPGCLVPSALFPRACAQGEVGTLEVEIVRASPSEPGGHGGCPRGLPVAAGLARPARKFCET